jgi:hypothetical protein
MKDESPATTMAARREAILSDLDDLFFHIRAGDFEKALFHKRRATLALDRLAVEMRGEAKR